MKKSFKILLLAVMALCLAAGAAFAELSSDVTFKVTSGDLSELSSDKNAVTGTLTLSADNGASISFDATIDGETPYILLALTSDDPLSIDIVSTDVTEGVYIVPSSVVSNSISFDLTVISTEAQAVTLTVHLSDDTASGDATLKVYITATEAADNFDGASIDVYYVVDEAEASKSVTVTTTASQSITVDVGSTVSFDVSASSSDLTSADGYTTSSDYMFVLTAPTTAGASVDVAFAFNKGAVVYTFRIVASGDSSSSGGDDGETTSITVDDIDEDTQEAIEAIIPSKYNKTITLEKLVEQLNKLIAVLTGVTFDTVSVDTAGDFGTVTAVKSDGTVVAAAFPAVNGSVFLPVNSGTISNSFPSSLPSFDEAVTAFGFTDFSDFTGKVFDEVTSLTEREADFTEDVATETFDITLGSALPYGTIVVFALQPTDDTLNLATQYVAMVINGTFGSTSETLTFDMNKVYNAADLQTKASITEGEYDIAYSTLDGAGKGVESAALKAAFEAAAAGEEGEVGYVGAVTLGTSSGEETTDEVSSHGSSSGCDAGFGALALLAVAGALAARKVRK